MSCRVLFTLCLLTSFDSQTAGKLIMKPRDTDIQVNQSTYFNCSTDIGSTSIFWFHGTTRVYIGFTILEPYTDRFAIDNSQRNGTYIYNLVIRSVQPKDTGEYICSDDEGYGEKYSVQLVVLVADPICRSNKELDEVIGQNGCNIEPDYLELECSVAYHGNIPPRMEWRMIGGSAHLEASNVTSENHFISTLKLKGDIALNNSSFVCETTRTTQEPIKCTSQVMRIVYAIDGHTILNRTIEDKIHCSANTSQSCIYKWKWLQDNDFTIESSTSILKARKPGWHRCEADCNLRNISCNLLVMKALIFGDTESSLTSKMIAYIVVTVIVTLVVVGASIFFILWIIKIRAGKSQPTTEAVIVEEKAFLKKGNPGDTTDLIVSDEAANTLIQERAQYAREKFETDQVALNELLKQEVRAIYGLAVLGQELFISRLQHPDIEVYDSTTFRYKRQMEVDGMSNPEHIVSCSVNNCLYAFDWDFREESCEILRINPFDGNLINSWEVYEGGGRMSVANDTNVILNINYKAKLHEYTAEGELIREIDLSEGTGIFRAWHAVKLPNDLFVVCHGDYDDPLSRVCLLSPKSISDAMGRIEEVEIVKIFGAGPGDSINRLKRPMYLSVDNEGSILVSDAAKQSVLLSSNFDKPKILFSEKDGMGTSWRTCFDESTNQWYVCDHHRVMVCRVKDDQVERKLHHLITIR